MFCFAKRSKRGSPLAGAQDIQPRHPPKEDNASGSATLTLFQLVWYSFFTHHLSAKEHLNGLA